MIGREISKRQCVISAQRLMWIRNTRISITIVDYHIRKREIYRVRLMISRCVSASSRIVLNPITTGRLAWKNWIDSKLRNPITCTRSQSSRRTSIASITSHRSTRKSAISIKHSPSTISKAISPWTLIATERHFILLICEIMHDLDRSKSTRNKQLPSMEEDWSTTKWVDLKTHCKISVQLWLSMPRMRSTSIIEAAACVAWIACKSPFSISKTHWSLIHRIRSFYPT